MTRVVKLLCMVNSAPGFGDQRPGLPTALPIFLVISTVTVGAMPGLLWVWKKARDKTAPALR